MNKLMFYVYRAVVPKPLRTIILKRNLREKILCHYSGLPAEEINTEQHEVLRYIQTNPVAIFPYDFNNRYSSELIQVFYDRERRLRYVMLDGKKLYFRRQYSEKRIKKAFADLLREQDPDSSHRYLWNGFDVNEDDVIADIGAAEGNFSLSVIDRVKKVYLFESDKRWSEALKATFEPYFAKYSIIAKRASFSDDALSIKLDTFFELCGDITFLKIDVDGAEEQVLKGCERILAGDRHLKIALCTYHKAEDEARFSGLLRSHGFKVSTSKGYMVPYYDKKLNAPWLRRGLLRAKR